MEPTPANSEQQALDVRISELERELSELKHRRNELSSISLIPSELLCEILLLATTLSDPDRYPTDIRLREEGCVKVLCHVCHAWRRIALGCPRLWQEVDVSKVSRPERVDFFVEHAHPLPLSLCIRGGSGTWIQGLRESLQRTTYTAMRRILLESGNNFNELTFIGSREFLVDYLAICPEGTQMRGIQVTNASFSYSNWWSDADVVSIPECRLVSQKAPDLRFLALVGCEVALTSPVLLSPNLTCIALGVPPGSVASQLFKILQSASKLQDLQLSFRHEFLPHSASHPPATVHLPRVARLLLTGSPAPILTVLKHISLSAPTVHTIVLCCVRSPMRTKRVGEKLYKAIGNSRRSSVRHWVDEGQPFSPNIVSIDGSREGSLLRGSHCIDAQYCGVRPSDNSAPAVSSTCIDIQMVDEAMCDVDDREWLPVFQTLRLEDFAKSTGWSPNAMEILNLANLNANWVLSSFWDLISEIPNLQQLHISAHHYFEFLPSLNYMCGPSSSDRRMDLPFPHLSDLHVHGTWPPGMTLQEVLAPLVAALEDRLLLALEYNLENIGGLDLLSIIGPLENPAPASEGVSTVLIKRSTGPRNSEPPVQEQRPGESRDQLE
ncbi:hypothetical protein NMY22_g7686 [Coprinellus aureogranulatus]|nr:hypothetical protein NMY22_g7686 [Coprinellus aureogranulatus]